MKKKRMAKQIISAVVAMNQDHVIGTNNELPWHIPEDLAYFKKVTLGKPIIMGRKTFESIGRILPGRRNIVISRGGFSYSGVDVYSSLEHAIFDLKDAPEICIIGGGEIFKQSMEVINSLHLTIVDYVVKTPTAWFPKINLEQWKIIERNEILSSNGVKCLFQHLILKDS